MSYKVMSQTATTTSFINVIQPDDTLKVSHDRMKPRVQGIAVPHVRLNVLSVMPRPYKAAGCDDACIAPGEVTDTVRVIASGPTVDKVKLIAQLTYIVSMLSDPLVENVWEGLPPSSATELPLTYVGG